MSECENCKRLDRELCKQTEIADDALRDMCATNELFEELDERIDRIQKVFEEAARYLQIPIEYPFFVSRLAAGTHLTTNEKVLVVALHAAFPELKPSKGSKHWKAGVEVFKRHLKDENSTLDDLDTALKAQKEEK